MIYLLEFKHESKHYFLHEGTETGSFIGATNLKDAQDISRNKLTISIPVGGFNIVGVTEKTLGEMVGVPYKIIDFTGGFGRGWSGVPIVHWLGE